MIGILVPGGPAVLVYLHGYACISGVERDAVPGFSLKESEFYTLCVSRTGRWRARRYRVVAICNRDSSINPNPVRSLSILKQRQNSTMPVSDKNLYYGPDALKRYFDPDSQPPLPLVELPAHMNPFYDDGVRIYAKMMTVHPANNVKAMPGMYAAF